MKYLSTKALSRIGHSEDVTSSHNITPHIYVTAPTRMDLYKDKDTRVHGASGLDVNTLCHVVAPNLVRS